MEGKFNLQGPTEKYLGDVGTLDKYYYYKHIYSFQDIFRMKLCPSLTSFKNEAPSVCDRHVPSISIRLDALDVCSCVSNKVE